MSEVRLRQGRPTPLKRSEINQAYLDALDCFRGHGWALPPEPEWDITDFGLGDFGRFGLTLVNLAAEPEYCEKLMYARLRQTTPCHAHARKKEDIICRAGELALRVWPAKPDAAAAAAAEFTVLVNGRPADVTPGGLFTLPAGSRVTLRPGIWHEFFPASRECIMGEVSTANDDRHDNFFLNAEVGRYPRIEEDEAPLVRLVGE